MSTQIADSPQRTAPPEEGPLPFSERCQRSQLEILEGLSSRNAWWRSLLEEAMSESKRMPALLDAALDACNSDAYVGSMLRELLVDYADRCAALQGDEITQL